MMQQLQFYKYSTWGLLFLNLSMVTFFLLTKPKHHPPHGPGKEKAGDILKLDKQQHDTFLSYAGEHIQQMKDFDQQHRNLFRSYFNTLQDAGDLSTNDSLLLQILQLEQKKIESTYQHFEEVRSILRPEQLGNFPAFIDHAMRIILPVHKGPPPPRKR